MNAYRLSVVVLALGWVAFLLGAYRLAVLCWIATLCALFVWWRRG